MNRISLLRVFFLCWFGAVLARLFYWQGIKASDLQASARRQYERPSLSISERGTISTSDGYPLVLNTKSYALVAKPHLMTQSADFLTTMIITEFAATTASPSAVLADDRLRDSLRSRLSDRSKKWVPLLPDISELTMSAIQKHNVPELVFEAGSKRLYPEASLSAHLLGFVGRNAAGQPQGYFGIEGKYDLELAGKTIKSLKETDAVGHPIGVSASVDEQTSSRSLSLTIRRDIQFLAQKHLEEGIQKYKAKSGYVLIMEPATGRVIAMAASPGYTPSDYANADPATFKNPIIADGYEPGSTLKVLTVAAGVDAGVITPETVCDTCSGPITIGKYTIKTWDNTYRAGSTVQEGLTHSDNTVMVFIGKKLGSEKLVGYLRAFGIGEKTGIDLQEESVPRLRSQQDWSEIDSATATFGQGIALTGLQMLGVVNTIANGGVLMRPYVVEKVTGSGEEFLTTPQQVRRVISETTAATVATMMQKSASQGDARWTLPRQYPIAGKTGTAQIPVAGHYDQERTIASFVGFSPVKNPKFSMLVRLVEPTTSQWGSETAAPLWFAIAKDLFVKFGISPMKTDTVQSYADQL